MKGRRSPGAWYRDPSAPGLERWWDGRRWTGSTRPIGATDYLWGSVTPEPPAVPVRSRRPGLAPIGVVPLVVVGLLVAGAAALLVTTESLRPRTDPGPPSGAASLPAASASTPGPKPTSTVPTAPSAGDALAVLATLPVKGPAPLTGYTRTGAFGAAWLDVDRNGCDTRDDILRRDLTDLVASSCRVRAGTLADPYTGHVLAFVRGNTTSTAVQIDHVVALANAWRTGAQRLTPDQRIALANDPVNLFAVDGPTNQQKGAGDAATWLPPNRAFRCTYVAHQIAVKRAYDLWVVPAERDAMARVLARCPATGVPRVSAPVAPPSGAGAAPEAVRSPSAAPSSPSTDRRYRSCADAKRAGGRTPYRRGQDPEYAWYHDGDGDGLVCE